MQTTVFIVDDHPLVIEGLKNILAQETSVKLIGSAINGKEALEFLKTKLPDVVLLDINLPDMSGIELCRKIAQWYPTVKCIGLSTFNENSYISRMIESGASGYLLKNSSKEEIMEALDKVKRGSMHLNVAVPSSTVTAQVPFITRREKEVLVLIAEGLTNQEIADKLFVSVTTIGTHRKNLLMKFNVNNTAVLIRLAAQNGLI